MISEEMLRSFPHQRMRANDGMAVTAEVWEESHDYHRHLHRFHTLLLHGTGIVTGLEVVASDPADRTVYVMPGVAMDGYGQTIIVREALAFDVGDQHEGMMRILLSYGESRPRAANNSQADAPLYIRQEFSIQATPELDGGPHVELARVRRAARDRPVRDARDPKHPGNDELDMRFRQCVGFLPAQVATVAVSYLGVSGDRRHGRGIGYLARTFTEGGKLQVQVDDDVSLSASLARYTLLALVADGAFQLGPTTLATLRDYHRGGGTLFLESCRQSGDFEAAEQALKNLLAALEVTVTPLPAEHPLLKRPHRFAAPPAGYEPSGTPTVRVGERVLWSSHDYACLWVGSQKGRPPARADIRTAEEWGHNMVHWALAQRAEEPSGGMPHA